MKKWGFALDQSKVLEKLADKKIKPDDLAEEVIANLNLLPAIMEGVSSPTPAIKFGCAKILRTVSDKKPDSVYAQMDFFIDILKSDNNIIKWNAMDVIGNLTRVDINNKFEGIFDRYYALLSDESMVTGGHVIDNSGKIALAKPHLSQKITNHLLGIEEISRSDECVNILVGKAIVAFDVYFDQIKDKETVIAFAKKHLNNTRSATKKKAERFLKNNQ